MTSSDLHPPSWNLKHHLLFLSLTNLEPHLPSLSLTASPEPLLPSGRLTDELGASFTTTLSLADLGQSLWDNQRDSLARGSSTGSVESGVMVSWPIEEATN